MYLNDYQVVSIKAGVEQIGFYVNNKSCKNNILMLVNCVCQLQKTEFWKDIYFEFIQRDVMAIKYRRMLLAIASNKSLSLTANIRFLPNSLSILYELSYIGENEIITYIEKGLINNRMSLQTARNLRHADPLLQTRIG